VRRKGKASPLEAGRGKEFPACEPKEGRGQVGSMPRPFLPAGRGGEENRPCKDTYITRKPRPGVGGFTAEAV